MRYLITLLFAALSFNAVGQIEWDFPYNPDADNDAFVSSTDLLELLAIYGEAFSTDELYLSQDSTSLIVKIGHEMNKIECFSGCMHLEGSWRVVNHSDAAYFYDYLTEELPIFDAYAYGNSYTLFPSSEYLWINNSGDKNYYPRASQLQPFYKNEWHGYGTSEVDLILEHPSLTYQITVSNLPEYNKCECWCVTHQRPKVEWHKISESLFDDMKEELSNDGWRLHSGIGGQLYFWRWSIN